jgi:hypothetical protein
LGSGLVRLRGTANDPGTIMKDGMKLSAVQVNVDDGPWQDVTLEDDGSWTTVVYVGDFAYGQSVDVKMKAIDWSGNSTVITKSILVDIETPIVPWAEFARESITVWEDAGPVNLTVNLSAATPNTVTVQYATSNGSAVAGSDYVTKSGAITFSPGVISQTISVPIIEDDQAEADESFSVILSNPNGATLGTSTAVITITDSDLPPSVGFSSSSYNAAENVISRTIQVELSTQSSFPVTVDYATSDGSATAGSDYAAVTGTLTFDPGQTIKSFSVSILDDVADESDETVNLTLSDPENATLGSPSTATLSITDDDGPPNVFFSSASYSYDEGVGSAPITVTLSASSANIVTVNYDTANGTASSPGDYMGVSGSLEFSPGQTTRTFNVPINEDPTDEPTESVNLTLSSPSNADLGSPSTATLFITDNSVPPSVFFSNASYSYDEGVGSATITATLSASSGYIVTVNYDLADGTASTPSDYTDVSGSLIFSPGQTTRTFSVPINDDPSDEPTETVNLSLSGPSNANLAAPSSATLYILDNDGLPTVSFSSSSYKVDEDAATVNIQLTLSPAVALTVTVDYLTSDGSAVAGSDYVTTSGSITFNPGVASRTITIPISDDDEVEGDEDFSLNLSGTSGAMLGVSTAVITIRDNDGSSFEIYLPVTIKLER